LVWSDLERLGEKWWKSLIISDNQAETCLIITINDTSLGYLPLIINISDTCKNQPKRLDFDNTINLSSFIVILGHGVMSHHNGNFSSVFSRVWIGNWFIFLFFTSSGRY
jgi:hypothetical protein